MRFLIPIAALSLLPACSESVLSPVTATSASTHREGVAAGVYAIAPPTAEAANVRVVESDKLSCSTEVLGVVDAHEEPANADRALNQLRAEAAKLGAEAVIGVGMHEKNELSGMAVRCNDLVGGRPYDVVERIEVPGESGDDEAAAVARIRERGRELQANLIIDVHMESSEGAAPRLLGTAIRFR